VFFKQTPLNNTAEYLFVTDIVYLKRELHNFKRKHTS